MTNQMTLDQAAAYRNGNKTILPFEHEEGYCDECSEKVDGGSACSHCGYARIDLLPLEEKYG